MAHALLSPLALSTIKDQTRPDILQTAGAAACYGYLRYSNDVQHPESIDRQEEDVIGTAKKFNLPMPHLFTDYAKTGQHNEREGLRQLIEAIKENPGCTVIVEFADRLFRSTGAFADLFKTIIDYEVRLYDRSGFIPPEMIPMHATMSVMELKRFRQRTAYQKRMLRREGKYHGTTPAGMMRPKVGIVVPHPSYERHYKRAFEMRAEGASYRAIALYLTEEQVPRPGKSAYWHPNTVRDILANPIYAGITVHYNGV